MAYPTIPEGTTPEIPPRDALDRIQPRRFNWLTAIRSQWGSVILEAFKQRVPDDFVSTDADEGGLPIAIVACPCGKEPVVRAPWGRSPVPHSVECDCGRFYLNLGKEVRVHRPEEVEPGIPKAG